MKEYTATYNTKKLKGVVYSFKAVNDNAAISFASVYFCAWPNIVITDDTTARAGEGRVIYHP